MLVQGSAVSLVGLLRKRGRDKEKRERKKEKHSKKQKKIANHSTAKFSNTVQVHKLQ
jgi:hypothetical protein